MLGRVRGRFHTGPLMVRTTDPFGLVQLDRQFVATSEVMITPRGGAAAARCGRPAARAAPARPARTGSAWSGQDDVLVREYRQGDDVRRIHWRSTARWGDLMVRREEQAWDPTRQRPARLPGRAPTPGAACTARWSGRSRPPRRSAIHFLDDGFGVEIYEADGSMRIGGTIGQHSSASSGAGGQSADRPAAAARRPPCTTRSSRPASTSRPAGGRDHGPDDRGGRQRRCSGCGATARRAGHAAGRRQLRRRARTGSGSGAARAGRRDPAGQPVAGDRGDPRDGRAPRPGRPWTDSGRRPERAQ